MLDQAQIRLDRSTGQASSRARAGPGDGMLPSQRGPDGPWRRLMVIVSIMMVLLIAGVVAVMLGWIHPSSLGG